MYQQQQVRQPIIPITYEQPRVVVQQRNIQPQQQINKYPQEQSPWMGDDVYMVAFLMSVELNRLREENDQLIFQKEQLDNRSRSFDIIEGELQDARLKMGDYAKKNALLQSDLEMWKSRFEAKDKEIDESRYQQDFQRRVLVDREIRELTSKFIKDRNFLENENKKLRQDFDELRLKHGSFDDVFQQATQIQEENDRLRQELLNFRQGFDQLEFAFKTATDLEQENEALKKELSEMRSRQLKMSQISSHLNANEVIIGLERENTELKNVLREVQEQSKRYPCNQKQQINLIKESSQQIERLNRELQAFENENKRLRDALNQQSGGNNRQDRNGY